MKNNIKSCEFNIDTACVEVKLIDGSMVSIDCIAVADLVNGYNSGTNRKQPLK